MSRQKKDKRKGGYATDYGALHSCGNYGCGKPAL